MGKVVVMYVLDIFGGVMGDGGKVEGGVGW